MTYYTPWLVPLEYVRQHRTLTDVETQDDDLLSELIAEASAEFIAALQRIPMPYVDSKQFGADRVSGLDLKLRDDLLAVTSITDGNGASVSGSDYNLRPDNHYPKHTIELLSISGSWWGAPYREDRITVAGTWGYVPHYLNGAWRQLTTLSANLSTTTGLTLTLTSTEGLSVGDYLKVDNETFGYITAVTSTTVTVDERGALGTTAATHTSSTAVYVYRQLPDIMKAVRAMVVYAYTSKDKIGGTTRIYDGGTLVVEDLDPSVDAARKRHMRKIMPKAV